MTDTVLQPTDLCSVPCSKLIRVHHSPKSGPASESSTFAQQSENPENADEQVSSGDKKTTEATVRKPQAYFDFLGLPPELRLMVYEQLPRIHKNYTIKLSEKTSTWQEELILVADFPISSILLTCRAISMEAQSILGVPKTPPRLICSPESLYFCYSITIWTHCTFETDFLYSRNKTDEESMAQFEVKVFSGDQVLCDEVSDPLKIVKSYVLRSAKQLQSSGAFEIALRLSKGDGFYLTPMQAAEHLARIFFFDRPKNQAGGIDLILVLPASDLPKDQKERDAVISEVRVNANHSVEGKTKRERKVSVKVVDEETWKQEWEVDSQLDASV